jgi:hypothetical protein
MNTSPARPMCLDRAVAAWSSELVVRMIGIVHCLIMCIRDLGNVFTYQFVRRRRVIFRSLYSSYFEEVLRNACLVGALWEEGFS